jgi:single-strand selective monofunctional uracil DNA glycosylase
MAELVQISRALELAVSKLEFGEPVTHVYNPLRYAKRPHELYLSRFGAGPKEAVLVGMNPGPFGMGQTGVPFGDVGFVRDWMGIEAPVARPPNEHPKRPVLGFECERSEVSGSRLWGWAKERFGTPERFFSRFLVINYCPLLFMESTGRNRTPDKLSAAERFALLSACDEALRAAVEVLDPKLVVGVGAWATKRALGALGHDGPAIGTVLHPSPASPKANRGWAPQAESDLRSLGIKL